MARTTFSGPVKSDNGFEGNITGDVTGNLDGVLGDNTPAAATVTTLTASGAAELTNAANVLVIPTSDPGVENALWLDGSTIKVSAGV